MWNPCIEFLNMTSEKLLPPFVVTSKPLFSPFVPANPGSLIKPIFSFIKTNFAPLWIWITPSLVSNCSFHVSPLLTVFSIPIIDLCAKMSPLFITLITILSLILFS